MAPAGRRPVTLVVLAWNRWALTRRLLDSIARFTDLERHAVTVVDNGSTDETTADLSKIAYVNVIRHDSNLGFVRGSNVGILASPVSNDVVLLNNDVEILDTGWLDRLQDAAHSAPDVGIAGCRVVLGDGRLLHAGAIIRPDTCRGYQIGSLELDLGQYADTREVQGVDFACVYLRREMLDRVGLLSEVYESYFEDTDYCLRAAARGWKTVCCGTVTVRHDEPASTSGDPELRQRVIESGRGRFREKWKRTLESRYRRSLEWQSTVNLPTGYAVSSREILRALDEAGVRLTYRYAYGPGTPLPAVEPADSGDFLIDLIRARRLERRPGIAVTYAYGDVFARNRGRYRIGFTMIEVDGFAREWVRQANTMDEVWTPSEFNRQGLLNSGVTKPVYVMPLGVDPQRFHPAITRVPNRSGDFVYLANLEWGERKYPELLLGTFNRVFAHDEPAVLVCRINNRDPTADVAGGIRSLGLTDTGGRIHLIVNRELPHYQLAALYRSADCFVTTARGEGWGLPLIEAMACGVPAIATAWGAHSEFLDAADTYLLRVRGTIPAVSRCPYYEGYSWSDPDGDHLAELLRHVYDNRDEARAKGLIASSRIRSLFTWKHTAAKILERLEGIEN